MAIKNLIQLRKGSASEWSSTNPVLASGEPGYDLTNNIIKIGDGTSSWNSLSALSIDLDTSLVGGTGVALSYNSSNNSLSINITGNYATSTHNHFVSDISNFASGVSGLLPTISNSGDNRLLTSTGSDVGINAESNLTFDGTNLSSPIFLSTNASGDEGGEIQLAKPPSGTLSGNIAIDSYQNKLRFFENGGTSRGYYLDLTTGSAGANTLIEAKSKTISVFTPNQNQPPSANFATLDTRNNILVLEFDATTEESAYFTGVIDEGRLLTNGITVRIYWMADTATSGNVRWGAQFEKTGTDLDSDSFDTNAQVTSAVDGTSGIESVASINISTIDSLSAGDRYRLKVYRVAADATNDTMSGDAQLVSLEVRAT